MTEAEEESEDVAVWPQVAADMLSMSRRTITRWYDDGELTGYRTQGGDRRIYTSSIQRILDKRKQENG